VIPNKESLRRHWKIILIFILALTPLRWFKQDFLIAKGDAFPFIEPLINFHRFSYTWLEFGTGSISQTPSYIIWMGIWYVLDVLRLPINVIQIILEALYFLGTGLSMYFLALTLYRNQSITPFVASVFYMFNFFMILRTLNSAVSWTLVFLPIMLAFYIRIVDNLKNNRKTTKNVIGFAVTSTILLSFASVNPPLLALIVMAFFILFAYYFTSEGNLRFELIKNLVFLSFVSILLNIWWIVSFLVYVSPSGAMRVGTVIDVVAWSWTHQRASFLNLFWLNGFWAWSRTYFPYFDAYSSPFMRFIVFIPMIVGFSALLFKNEYRKINSYFGIIIVLLIFLAKGLHPPFEDINLFFYKYVPGFLLFREPFGKFYIILIIFLALLIGSSCNAIVEFIKNTRISHRAVISSIFIGFIITSFLVQTFPLLTGEVITSLTQFSPYIQIPNYWDRMSDYINSKDEDFKILLTPDTSSYVGYDWGYYGIDELASRLITKPVLKHPYSYLVNSNYEKIIMAVYEKN
jgi:arabinofuranan 3-O-arabinosyltransferase